MRDRAAGPHAAVDAAPPRVREYRMTTVLLSLGSNLEPARHLGAALRELRAAFGELAVSPAYLTPAVGFDGPDFLNNAVSLETDLSLIHI